MSSKRFAGFLAAAALWPLAAGASLIGSSVTGQLFSPVTNTTMNLFDPVNGFVPAGYGNSSGTTVSITDPGVEFAFLQGGGTVASPGVDSITADFTGSTLKLSEQIAPSFVNGVAGWQVEFTNSAFSGLTLTKLSDNFAQGGFTGSLSGDVLTLTVGAACTGPCSWLDSQQAQFSLASASAPEPSPLWLLIMALSGFGFHTRQQWIRRVESMRPRQPIRIETLEVTCRSRN